MRILVLSNFIPPGRERGYELACYNLCKGLRARGHEVRILTSPTVRHPVEEQNFVDRELSVREFTTTELTGDALHLLLQHEARVSQLANTQIVLKKIREFRPDHILTFNLVGIGGLSLLDLVDATGVPWTMNLGDWVPNELILRVPDEIREVFDVRPAEVGGLFSRGRIAAVSQRLIDEITNGGVNLGEDVTVIPRGLAVSGVTRSRPHREGGVTRFVSAGAIAPQKGLDLILGATKVVHDAAEFEFTLDVFGGGALDHYRERVAELGISDRVTFHGHVSQREVVIANSGSDAFLFPTWAREPGASVAIEAAAVGAIPVMTGDCGPAERFVDGISAIKIRRTIESVADAMSRIGRGEIDLEAMAEAGARLAAGDLSFEVSVDRLERVLESAPAVPKDNRIDDPELDVQVASRHARALEIIYATAKTVPRTALAGTGKG